MASQTLAGLSIPAFDFWRHAGSSMVLASNVIDATGEKAAFVGPVFFASRTGTKDIRTVGFRFGAVTKAGGSGLTVSLQDVSTAAGPPARPDETQDQTVAVANANGSFASNTWLQTGNLSADRTVAFGEMLAVVIEFDGSGRLGADSVAISGVSQAANHAHRSHAVVKLGGTWQLDSSIAANIILGFSDGTFGTLQDAFPCSALSSFDYDANTSPDEYALRIQFPGPVSIDAAGAFMVFDAATADADIVAYDGTTPITNGTVSINGRHAAITGNFRPTVATVFGGQLALTANTPYRIALKPTTTGNVILAYFDVANADHLQAHIGGIEWYLSSRVNGGAWTDTTTRRPMLWPYISAIDDGAGGGGGGTVYVPQMSGQTGIGSF
jgi:hypothetical protein